MFRLAKIALALCWISALQPAAAATVYVYQHPSGAQLLTDHPGHERDGYRLVRQYRVADHAGSSYSPPRAAPTPATAPAPVSSRYDGLILAKAGELGLEAALLKAIVHVESSFDPHALSPKGAKGLMQLMPATARRYGVTSREDSVASIEGGGRYLRDLLELFRQDTSLALAAYNAGENAVARYNGIPPYPETRNYVQRVLRLRNQYRAAWQ